MSEEIEDNKNKPRKNSTQDFNSTQNLNNIHDTKNFSAKEYTRLQRLAKAIENAKTYEQLKKDNDIELEKVKNKITELSKEREEIYLKLEEGYNQELEDRLVKLDEDLKIKNKIRHNLTIIASQFTEINKINQNELQEIQNNLNSDNNSDNSNDVISNNEIIYEDKSFNEEEFIKKEHSNVNENFIEKEIP